MSVVSVQRLIAMYKVVKEMCKDHVPLEWDVETLTAIVVITAKVNHVLWINASNLQPIIIMMDSLTADLRTSFVDFALFQSLQIINLRLTMEFIAELHVCIAL